MGLGGTSTTRAFRGMKPCKSDSRKVAYLPMWEDGLAWAAMSERFQQPILPPIPLSALVQTRTTQKLSTTHCKLREISKGLFPFICSFRMTCTLPLDVVAADGTRSLRSTIPVKAECRWRSPPPPSSEPGSCFVPRRRPPYCRSCPTERCWATAPGTPFRYGW